MDEACNCHSPYLPESKNNVNCKENLLPTEHEFKYRSQEEAGLRLEMCRNMFCGKSQLTPEEELLQCVADCTSCVSSDNTDLTKQLSSLSTHQKQKEPCKTVPSDGQYSDGQLRDLQEQYTRLQEDYKNKVCEVSYLRADLVESKSQLKELEMDKRQLECHINNLERKLTILEAERANREKLIEQEQAFVVMKHRYREAQEEIEEMRNNIQVQISQTEEYRKKYLQAQQMVEEQKRQLDLMEMDNARINENVTLEIGRIKNQFQEKLSELAPLPEVLKETQLKLKESLRQQFLLEQSCNELNQEIVCLRDKLRTADSQIELLSKENAELQRHIENLCKLKDQLCELKSENECLKKSLSGAEEQQENFKKRLEEKLHEIAQLTATIEGIREDSARQIVRAKERSEIMRKSLQNKISEMEKELAQCKAITRSAQKDRDEIRQKMQNQINIISESFAQVQGRIHLLQGHVNYLKDPNNGTHVSQNQEELSNPSESVQNV